MVFGRDKREGKGRGDRTVRMGEGEEGVDPAMLIAALMFVICDVGLIFIFSSSSSIMAEGMIGLTLDKMIRFDLAINGRISKLCAPMFTFVWLTVSLSAMSFVLKYIHTRPWDIREL